MYDKNQTWFWCSFSYIISGGSFQPGADGGIWATLGWSNVFGEDGGKLETARFASKKLQNKNNNCMIQDCKTEGNSICLLYLNWSVKIKYDKNKLAESWVCIIPTINIHSWTRSISSTEDTSTYFQWEFSNSSSSNGWLNILNTIPTIHFY